jgi:hypothetical protein
MQRSGTSPDLSGFVQAATGGFWAMNRQLREGGVTGRYWPTQPLITL